MTKKQNAISQSWLYVILILFFLFGAVTLMSTLEMSKLKLEQIRIYNRINNMEQSLRTKDRELDNYLIKDEISSGAE
ncbi:MAG: hypothetical protein EOM50_22815 [Erysipelotrichia bacterium]|nr:hypothetical protein [Erysipelotrichia bacterium]